MVLTISSVDLHVDREVRSYPLPQLHLPQLLGILITILPLALNLPLWITVIIKNIHSTLETTLNLKIQVILNGKLFLILLRCYIHTCMSIHFLFFLYFTHSFSSFFIHFCLGFNTASVTDKEMTIEFHNSVGAHLYTVQIPPNAFPKTTFAVKSFGSPCVGAGCLEQPAYDGPANYGEDDDNYGKQFLS